MTTASDSSGLRLRLGQFEPCTTALGPGKRAGVWVQGCPFRCPGCCSPHFLEPGGPEKEITVEALVGMIAAAQGEHGLEGVSFSGGEPFAQAVSLAAVAAGCRRLGLSTLAWTGYTLERLRRSDEASPKTEPPPGSAELLANLDLLIDGPYRHDLPTAPLRGSTNQRIIFLSDRYSPLDISREIQADFRVDEGGGVRCYGIVDDRLKIVFRLLGLEMTDKKR